MHLVAFEDIYGREVVFNSTQITKMKAFQESSEHPGIEYTKVYTSDGDCETIPLELEEVAKRIAVSIKVGVSYA